MYNSFMVFKKKYNIWFQLVLGIICGFLNMFGSKMAEGLALPIFNDTLFTVLASFFGWTAGITSALGYHILFCLFIQNGFSGFFFVICSLSMVLIVRFYIKNKETISLMDFIFMIFISALVISFEGGLIFVFVFTQFDFKETVEVNKITYILIRQQIPLLISSWLSRIPINLLDKTLAVLAGGYGAIGLGKLFGNHFQKKDNSLPQQKN